jgi:predicted nucleic acid-binding protein
MIHAYFDSGVLLKLYTAEPDSPQIQDFIHRHRSPLHVTSLHLAEFASALSLKAFRRECELQQAQAALGLVKKDVQSGILCQIELDWERALQSCSQLSTRHSHQTGTRTLDALHVACACALGAKNFVTTDGRQTAMAKLADLRTIDPKDSPRD